METEGTMPSSFDVLGAKTHGLYSDVLEFQSLLGDKLPQMRPNDLLIEISFTDVNPVDLQKLRGRDNMLGQPVNNAPHVPGYGGSGKVVGVGSEISDAASWKGKRVCFLADPSRLGSYATHILVDVNCVAKISNSSDEESVLRDCACIPVAGLTAYESLAKCGLIANSSDSHIGSLLVVGASGGVGSWTITLARALNPSLQIIASASNQDQHDWCISLGADRVIKHDEITSKLECGREGSVDAIICLTEPTQDLFGGLSDVVKPYGTICLVVAGKSIGSLNLGFCFFKCVNVKTETVFSSIRTKYRKIVPSNELGHIIDLLASGKIKAPLSPALEGGKISESFRKALGEDGVLKALSEPTGRRGNFIMKID